MIIAIMMGRAGSTGFPGKNTKKILGKGMCEYPIIAARKSKYVNEIFISTDCKIIKRQTKKYKVNYLHRSKKLASNKALGEHVYQDAYFQIKKIVKEAMVSVSSSDHHMFSIPLEVSVNSGNNWGEAH